MSSCPSPDAYGGLGAVPDRLSWGWQGCARKFCKTTEHTQKGTSPCNMAVCEHKELEWLTYEEAPASRTRTMPW